MNNLEKDRQIIRKILTDYHVFLRTYSHLESKLIISEDENNYLIVLYGLHDNQQFHDFIVHVQIKDNIHLIRDDICLDNKLSNAGVKGLTYYQHYSQPFQIEFAISLEKIYELHKSVFVPGTNPKQPIIKLDATPSELRELARIESKDIGIAIAFHPNISLDLLLELFSQFPAEIFANPSFNLFMGKEPNFLRILFDTFPSIFHQDNLEIPDFFIEWAVNHEQENIRGYIAKSNAIPAHYLEKLVHDKNCRIIACLYSRGAYPSSNPLTYFKDEIKELLARRYSQFTKTCEQRKKDGYCDCTEILANL
jgi:hypothetical protein